MKVLYADCGEQRGPWSPGKGERLWIAVADEGGTLLEAQPVEENTNLAEMLAVERAAHHADAPRGVILTDSLTAVRMLDRSDFGPYGVARPWVEGWRARMRDALPEGWVVAWVPRKGNLADKALRLHLRKRRAA